MLLDSRILFDTAKYCISLTFRRLIVKHKKLHKPSKGKGIIFNLLEYYEAADDPDDVPDTSHIELNTFRYALPQDSQSGDVFITPYVYPNNL